MKLSDHDKQLRVKEFCRENCSAFRTSATAIPFSATSLSEAIKGGTDVGRQSAKRIIEGLIDDGFLVKNDVSDMRESRGWNANQMTALEVIGSIPKAPF